MAVVQGQRSKQITLAKSGHALHSQLIKDQMGCAIDLYNSCALWSFFLVSQIQRAILCYEVMYIVVAYFLATVKIYLVMELPLGRDV